MAALDDLRDLFVDELRDIYDAEHRITKALPKMRKAAGSDELQEAFDMHLQETEGHIARLEQVTARAAMQDAIVHTGLLPRANEERVDGEEGVREIHGVSWRVTLSPEDDDLEALQLMERVAPIRESRQLLEQPT